MQQEHGYQQQQYYAEAKIGRNERKQKQDKGLYKLVKEVWSKIRYGLWVVVWFMLLYSPHMSYGETLEISLWGLVGAFMGLAVMIFRVSREDKDKYEKSEMYVGTIGLWAMNVVVLSVPILLVWVTVVLNHF